MKFIIIFLLFISEANSENQAPPPNVKTQGGRYQLIQLSIFGSDQFLLDTQTGKLWNKRCVHQNEKKDCDVHAWMTELVEDINVNRKALEKAASD